MRATWPQVHLSTTWRCPTNVQRDVLVPQRSRSSGRRQVINMLHRRALSIKGVHGRSLPSAGPSCADSSPGAPGLRGAGSSLSERPLYRNIARGSVISGNSAATQLKAPLGGESAQTIVDCLGRDPLPWAAAPGQEFIT